MIQLWGDDYPEGWVEQYKRCERNHRWLRGCGWAIIIVVLAFVVMFILYE